MKEDKYEELKPGVFEYEDRLTPTLKIGAIAVIVFMIAILILFGMFICSYSQWFRLLRKGFFKMNRWKSKYGDRFISLPSVIEQSGLRYELLEIQ
jgi:hypothetical protein